MSWEDILKLGNWKSRPDITKEEYDNLDRDAKKKYHIRMAGRYKRANDDTLYRWHYRAFARMRKDEYTAPYDPSDNESWPENRTGIGSEQRGKGRGPKRFIPQIQETKEEYEQMSPHEKKKYHGKMKARAEKGINPFHKGGDKAAMVFHSKMVYRSLVEHLPTWYSIAEMEKDEK